MRLCVVKQGSTPLGVSVILVVAFKEEASVIDVQGIEITDKMYGYKVQNNADIFRMSSVYELHKPSRVAVTAGCGEISRHLIAP